MGSTVDRQVVLEQGEAGAKTARFNFLIFFIVSNMKDVGYSIKYNFPTFPFFYICNCVQQVAKLVVWWSSKREVPGRNPSWYRFDIFILRCQNTKILRN